jgi:cytochrome c553
MACHGPDGSGNALARFPSIGGQHAKYTAAQLRAYRDGTRSSDPQGMMRDIASRLTDAEIDALSEYLAGLH